jgi:uncharacterized glyoxalase superfamily protein PhnB
MTDARTVSSEVEVAVDPGTAFTAFTDEMDLWWDRGYINFWSDGGRVVEVRCEPGVGGRIVEVLDDASGNDVFERGRITGWEPGSRLAWENDFDDVLTEVRFERVPGGTRVVVEHTIPADGRDAGGTAWSRVVPKWFGAWCARRDRAARVPDDLARLSLVVAYERPAAAARWLAAAFGFGTADDLPTGDDPLPHGEHGHPWIEFRLGNASLMLTPLEGARADGARVFEPWVYVDDLAAHFAHAKGNGATIVEEIDPFPTSHYVVDDLEGNRWTFLQARPTMR